MSKVNVISHSDCEWIATENGTLCAIAPNVQAGVKTPYVAIYPKAPGETEQQFFSRLPHALTFNEDGEVVLQIGGTVNQLLHIRISHIRGLVGLAKEVGQLAERI